MRGVVTDVIIHAKVFVNRFRGFGVLTPQNFPISIRLAGQSYNSVSTAVLHCDESGGRVTKHRIRKQIKIDNIEFDFTKNKETTNVISLLSYGSHFLADSSMFNVRSETKRLSYALYQIIDLLSIWYMHRC